MNLTGRKRKRRTNSILQNGSVLLEDQDGKTPESNDLVWGDRGCKETGIVSLALLLWITTVGINRKKKKKHYLKLNFLSERRRKHIKAFGCVSREQKIF